MKTLDGMLKEINQFLRESPDGGRLWDLMTASRGPDSPSERPDMSSTDYHKAYEGRRIRKYNTVEVIRARAFPFASGCRKHSADYVTLPPPSEHEHFDRHVQAAALALGLRIDYKNDAKQKRY